MSFFLFQSFSLLMPMSRAPYITRQGYQRLSDEISHLLRVRRPELTRAVSEAAALGDRSENAEYIYGKKLLRETDRRIRFLQKRLPELQVIERLPDQPERIFFGAYVNLEDEQGEILEIRIVGSDEFIPEKHWISIESPLAKALLGKQIDDEINVNLPNNKRANYVITHILYKI
jgi:transcription elongation factor GreB